MRNFFVLIVRNEISGAKVGPEAGTKYSFEAACNKCGTGARVDGKFFVAKQSFKHRVLCFSSGGVILHKDIAKGLSAYGVNSLNEVWSKNQKLDFLQIEAQDVLPPFFSGSKNYSWDLHCQSCQRDGYFCKKEPINIVYKALPLKFSTYHVLATFEGFGYSFLREPFSNSHFAGPLFVVSEDVKTLFLKANLAGIEFSPVKVERFS